MLGKVDALAEGKVVKEVPPWNEREKPGDCEALVI